MMNYYPKTNTTIHFKNSFTFHKKIIKSPNVCNNKQKKLLINLNMTIASQYNIFNASNV